MISILSIRQSVLILLALALTACGGGEALRVEDFSRWEGMGRYTATIDTDAGPIDVSYIARRNPERQRIIYVHGTPGSAGAFAHMLRLPDFPVDQVTVDRPGFGRTEPGRAVTSLKAQAQSLLPFLEHEEGRAKPILVGHSLGGPIIAAAAALYPEKVGGLIILAGSLDPEQEEVLWVQYLGLVPPFSWLVGPEYRNANRELVALEAELKWLETQLDRVTAPIEIIHGTDDRLVPYANVAYMQQKFANAQSVNVTSLEGARHFIPWSHPGELLWAIDRMTDMDLQRHMINTQLIKEGKEPLDPDADATIRLGSLGNIPGAPKQPERPPKEDVED